MTRLGEPIVNDSINARDVAHIQRESDKRWIAALPDLAEALEMFCKAYETDTSAKSAYEKAIAALIQAGVQRI